MRSMANHTHRTAAVLLTVSNRGQIEVKAHMVRRVHEAATPMNLGSPRGMRDRNRTGAQRLWSARCAVQTRLRLSKSVLIPRFFGDTSSSGVEARPAAL